MGLFGFIIQTLQEMIFVGAWSLLAYLITVHSFSQLGFPTYKEWLSATIAIFIESVGIELFRGADAIIVPLVGAIGYSILVRYFLPENEDAFSIGIASGRTASLIFQFFALFASFLLLWLTIKDLNHFIVKAPIH